MYNMYIHNYMYVIYNENDNKKIIMKTEPTKPEQGSKN